MTLYELLTKIVYSLFNEHIPIRLKKTTENKQLTELMVEIHYIISVENQVNKLEQLKKLIQLYGGILTVFYLVLVNIRKYFLEFS